MNERDKELEATVRLLEDAKVLEEECKRAMRQAEGDPDPHRLIIALERWEMAAVQVQNLKLAVLRLRAKS